MRCVICGRVLLNKPAQVIGRAAFGPKCAKLAGLVQPKTRAADVVRDALTRDWVQEVAHV